MLCSQFGFVHRCRIVVSPLIVLLSISFIAHFLSSFTNVCFSPVRLVGDTCLRVFFLVKLVIEAEFIFPDIQYLILSIARLPDALTIQPRETMLHISGMFTILPSEVVNM